MKFFFPFRFSNLKCEVLIYSIWAADGVRLAFDWTDLEPPERPGDYSTCRDKIVVYDGILAFHFNFEVVPWFFFFMSDFSSSWLLRFLLIIMDIAKNFGNVFLFF